MSTKWAVRVAGPCALAGLTAVALAGLAARPDRENVVASRLAGQWVVDRALTTRLRGKPQASIPPGNEVEFTSDPAVAGKIPKKYHDLLKAFPIYMAGTMKMRGKPYPFILIGHKGNPCVMYFRERDGDPMGDAESFNVMLAPAKEKGNGNYSRVFVRTRGGKARAG